MSTEMKLYGVTTTAHEYHGCRDVSARAYLAASRAMMLPNR